MAGAEVPRIAGSRAVFIIAVPAMATNIATALIGIVDTWVMGQTGNAVLVAAVGMGAAVIWLATNAFNFLRTGTIALTAQADGSGNQAEIVTALIRALAVALALGGMLLALYPLARTAGIAAFSAAPDVAIAAAQYVSLRWVVVPLVFANMVLTGWLLGQARATSVLVIEVAYNIANAVLSIWMVLALDMGVTGVALASVAAEVGKTLLAGLLCAGPLRRLRAGVSLGAIMRHSATWAWPQFARLLSVNRDLFIRTLLLMAVLFVFQRVSAMQGPTLQAANHILFQLLMVSTLMLDGFENAAQVLCGSRIGARDGPGFAAYVQVNLRWGLIFALGMGLFFLLAGPVLCRWFAPDAPTLEAALHYLPWLWVLPLIGAASFVYDGIFIGATWTWQMLVTMVFGALAFAILLTTMRMGLGNHGLWLAHGGMLAARGIGQWLWMPRLSSQLFQPVQGSRNVQS